MSTLLLVSRMPRIERIEMPRKFYWVTSEPAPLAGMAYPSGNTPWDELYASGFRHIVCLTGSKPHYRPAPLGLLHCVSLELLIGGGPPADPEKEERLIREATLVASDRLYNGEGAIVHCDGGTGRTGTVLGCILRCLGLPSSAVVEYLDQVNKQRGRPGWPESPWQAEVIDRFGSSWSAP